jgi:NADH-quinone oxidoreductase subunit E
MSDTAAMLDRVDDIVAEYQARSSALIMILQEIQEEYSYLPKEALERVGEKLDLAVSQVYGVATFYKAFSLEPRGRHHICVCTGTACHVRNSESIAEKLERDLGVTRGKTRKDGEVSLETVNCVGCCALGPVVLVDGKYWGRMTVSDTERMLKESQVTPAVRVP